MALIIQEIKCTGPGEGVDLGAEEEGGGQACCWGDWGNDWATQ